MLTAASAMAGTAEAAGRGITYDCDTAAGHFSELILPRPAGPFSVSGKIQVNQIAIDKKWAPLARVRIASPPSAPGQTPSAYAGFVLTALPGKTVSMAAPMIQMLSFDASGREQEAIPQSLAATPGRIEPFSLAFDGQAVNLVLGTATKRIGLATSAPVLQILCSTGEFLMTTIVISPAP